jgi:ApaG protein
MSRKPITSSLAVLFPHAATTGAVTVRVAVSYLAEQSDPSAGRWFWSYHIRIENAGPNAIQLLSRWWQIEDGRGTVHDVVGDGVVGEMPLIAPGASYDYVSGCPLPTASGTMEGSFGMVNENGDAFDATIPRFILTGPAA